MTKTIDTAQRIRLDVNHMMEGSLPSGGVSLQEIASLSSRAGAANAQVQKARGTSWLGWT